jgi:hypothetical protein
MTKDLQSYDVVDAEILDDTCESTGLPWCPGGPAPLVEDPFDGDVNNTRRFAHLHDRCAYERAQDI